MPERIAQRTNALSDRNDARELKKLLDAAQTDLTNIRAAIVGINAKLDADGGVTGTDYGSLWNPAALEFKK